MAEYENHPPISNFNGVSGSALGLGIASTALGLANGGMGLLGLGGYGSRTQYVTKDEAELQSQLAGKDSEIALLKSEQNTEIKMTEVYRQAHSEIAALRDKFEAAQKEQYGINTQQAVWNATNMGMVGCLQKQVEQLQGMTKLYIPSENVTPAPMDKYNSWTAPT